LFPSIFPLSEMALKVSTFSTFEITTGIGVVDDPGCSFFVMHSEKRTRMRKKANTFLNFIRPGFKRFPSTNFRK